MSVFTVSIVVLRVAGMLRASYVCVIFWLLGSLEFIFSCFCSVSVFIIEAWMDVSCGIFSWRCLHVHLMCVVVFVFVFF